MLLFCRDFYIDSWWECLNKKMAASHFFKHKKRTRKLLEHISIQLQRVIMRNNLRELGVQELTLKGVLNIGDRAQVNYQLFVGLLESILCLILPTYKTVCCLPCSVYQPTYLPAGIPSHPPQKKRYNSSFFALDSLSKKLTNTSHLSVVHHHNMFVSHI